MLEKSLMARWDGQEPDDVCKIAISPEYLAGRASAESGETDYMKASEHLAGDLYRRLDHIIGHHDVIEGIAIEQRAGQIPAAA